MAVHNREYLWCVHPKHSPCTTAWRRKDNCCESSRFPNEMFMRTVPIIEAESLICFGTSACLILSPTQKWSEACRKKRLSTGSDTMFTAAAWAFDVVCHQLSLERSHIWWPLDCRFPQTLTLGSIRSVRISSEKRLSCGDASGISACACKSTISAQCLFKRLQKSQLEPANRQTRSPLYELWAIPCRWSSTSLFIFSVAILGPAHFVFSQHKYYQIATQCRTMYVKTRNRRRVIIQKEAWMIQH